jgi:hypothetical protein
VTQQFEEVIKQRKVLIKRLKNLNHTYHNYYHTTQVVDRVSEFLEHLDNPILLSESSKFLLIESAWRHDDLHCGKRYRQLSEGGDLSNEEVSVLQAKVELNQFLNIDQLNEIESNILGTSFGQSNIEILPDGNTNLLRNYQADTIPSKILALADIASFMGGILLFAMDSYNVIREGDITTFPSSYSTWSKQLDFFINEFTIEKLCQMEGVLEPDYLNDLKMKRANVAKQLLSGHYISEKLYEDAVYHLSDLLPDDWIKTSEIISSKGIERMSISCK